MEQTGPTARVFVRQSTGLVKEFGLWLCFIITIGTLNLGLDIAQLYYATPATLPGSDVGLLLTLALIPIFFWGLGYAMMSAAMPRSGGDYVWTGRSLTGLGGFAFGFFFISFFIISQAYNGVIVSSFVFSQFFAVQGVLSHSVTLGNIGAWLAQPAGTFVGGTLFEIFGGVVVIFGIRSFRYVQTLLILVGFAGLAIMVAVIAATSNSQFVQTFNSEYSGTTSYQNILNVASQQGVNTTFSLAATVSALPFALLVYAGFTFNTYVAGETKNTRRNVPLGILLAVTTGWAFMTGLWYLLINTFGQKFITSVGVLAFVSPSKYPLPVPPTLNYFAGLIAGSPLISLAIGLGFVAWAILICPNVFLTLSRVMFAMSFDRLLPRKLSDVSERFHAPTYAVIVSVLITIILLGFMSFTNIVSISVAIGMGWGVVASIAGVAMMAFPFTKKQLFAQAPTWVRKKFGPVPALSLVGAGLTGWMLLATYDGVATSTLLIANVVLLALVPVGLIIYPLIREVRKRQGIALPLAFAELPPE